MNEEKKKRKRAPWQVTGSRVEGYWAYWPVSGARFMRRFETEEQATAYIPVQTQYKGRKVPFGEKRILRVVYGDAFTQWTYDIVRVFSQDEVDEQFLKMAAEFADGS